MQKSHPGPCPAWCAPFRHPQRELGPQHFIPLSEAQPDKESLVDDFLVLGMSFGFYFKVPEFQESLKLTHLTQQTGTLAVCKQTWHVNKPTNHSSIAESALTLSDLSSLSFEKSVQTWILQDIHAQWSDDFTKKLPTTDLTQPGSPLAQSVSHETAGSATSGSRKGRGCVAAPLYRSPPSEKYWHDNRIVQLFFKASFAQQFTTELLWTVQVIMVSCWSKKTWCWFAPFTGGETLKFMSRDFNIFQLHSQETARIKIKFSLVHSGILLC